jgi:hypothetical protein
MEIAKFKKLRFKYEKEYIDARGLEPLTHEEAKEMLFRTQALFAECGIDIYLCFGTLLGAVRDKDFIKGDTDADVYVKDEGKVFEMLPFFHSKGLKLVRYKPHVEFSFRYETTKKYFIDVFILRKASGIWRLYCYGLNKWVVPKKYVKNDDTIAFLGRNFKCAQNPERLLEFWYGSDWRTPIGKFDAEFKYDVKSHIYFVKWKRKFQRTLIYRCLRVPFALVLGRKLWLS